MLIVDGIIHLVDLVVFERNLELILYLHAVDCFQGLYWNRLFVGLSAGNVTSGQIVLCTSTEYCFLLFLVWPEMSKLFQCCTYAILTVVLLRKLDYQLEPASTTTSPLPNTCSFVQGERSAAKVVCGHDPHPYFRRSACPLRSHRRHHPFIPCRPIPCRLGTHFICQRRADRYRYLVVAGSCSISMRQQAGAHF